MSKKAETWSIAQIQNRSTDDRKWGEKKTIYASEADKCLRGVYHGLLGEKQTEPPDPAGIRRMDVGSLIEHNQVKKLKSLGIMLDAQSRIFDEEYKVSGRPDGIIISPTQCTSEAKKMIKRRQEIYKELQDTSKNLYKGIDKYRNKEITTKEFKKGRDALNDMNDKLFDEDHELVQELLIPNPKNSLMVLEIKSISEWGFKWRQNESCPMESHEKQLMFYFWKLRETYPNMVARVLYVEATYQKLLEFDVEFKPEIIEKMKEVWRYIWDCVEKKKLPVLPPTIIQNPKTRRWQVNYLADYCGYHSLCTGDPAWKKKAIAEVKKLNGK